MKKSIIILLVALCAGVSASATGRWRGDLNGDDRVDMADMVTLANAIKAGSADKELDLNASGKVDDYDLDALANIILSGQLTENSGLNVGIGGWDDSGEDFGGTVSAPAYPGTRSAESTRFYIGNPRENGGRYLIDFGIEEADATATAFLFNIRLPEELSFEGSDVVTLDGAALDGHRLYGKARITRQDEWSPRTLRFILFSRDMKPLKITRGVLGQLHYACDADWTMDYSFEDCQMVLAGSNGVVTPEVSGNWIYWKPVAVSSIWFDIQDMEMRKGDQQWISANIDPWEATDRSVRWSSSDAGVVTVAPESGNPQSAVINAVKAGNATITATTSNGLTATCNVRVTQDVEGITVDRSELRLTLGGDPTLAAAKLTATVLPEDATDKTILWYSQNESIASVDSEGNVTAQHAGEVDIIAQTNIGHQAICHVTVNQLATGIALDQTDVTLRIGESMNLYATVSPEDVSDRSLEWSSSDNSVVSVNGDGFVSALKVGSATVTVTTKDGSNLSATAVVRVHPIPVETISIEGLPEGEIEVGMKFRLHAVVLPEDATDASVTWSVDDETVATIDNDGNVEIVGEGSTVIRVTANDGSGCEAICIIDAKAGVELMVDDTKPFRVFDINGRLIMNDAYRTILPMLPKGIYILVQGNASTKFIH